MDRELLAQKLFQACYIKGDFLLRSGQRSHEYFDKYRFESQPELLRAIAQHMAALIPKDIDMLAGLELGGVPIATALSLQCNLPVVFVRKKAKDYGTCQFAEGADIRGKKLLVIEDVVTTGGQLVLSTQDLRQGGAIVQHALCVLYRGSAAIASQENSIKSIHLNLQALYNFNDIKKPM